MGVMLCISEWSLSGANQDSENSYIIVQRTEREWPLNNVIGTLPLTTRDNIRATGET